jgi:hypothetical protein
MSPGRNIEIGHMFATPPRQEVVTISRALAHVVEAGLIEALAARRNAESADERRRGVR